MLNFLLSTFLFTTLFVLLVVAAIWVSYRRTWLGPQRWMEATRHKHRLALQVGRWIWFKWIHLDCQYWILHVDFSAGPIEVNGNPPAGCYWSFTWNKWTETNPSVNSETVKLKPDGSYLIVFSKGNADYEEAGNPIPVSKNARRGVIYFRVYESPYNFPAKLPSVWQNGKLLTRGDLS